MSKTIILFRHAKSDWSDSGMRDFDRPLNARGMRDAPRMGGLMKQKGIVPDCVLSSTAERAKTTAIMVCEQLGIGTDQIQWEQDIYEASVRTLMRVVNELPDQCNTVILFGHNPGLTYFAEFLTSSEIGNLPTAGYAHMQARCGSWAEVSQGNVDLVAFEYPKKHFHSPDED